MANSPKKPTDDEDVFNATVKRLLDTPPTPFTPKPKPKAKPKAKKK